MKTSHHTAFVLVCFTLFATLTNTQAQESHIVLEVINGKNGKLLANQHLIVFWGNTVNDTIANKAHSDVTTSRDGIAYLSVNASMQWIQVWPDWRILCQSGPNSNAFNVNNILTKGAIMPNTCGKAVASPKPGELVIFVRPLNLWERMKQ